MADVVNRYANQDLFIAQDVSDQLSDFVSRSDKDAKAFARQIDAWWLAIGIGVKIGHRTPLPEKTVKFNDGGILSSDPWRIPHLEALALSEEGERILDNPSQVVRIASEYANTGFPWLISQMLGEAEPTLTLMNHLDEYVETSLPDPVQDVG
jgi:hypothetical protein